jgi:hypothetical protein
MTAIISHPQITGNCSNCAVERSGAGYCDIVRRFWEVLFFLQVGPIFLRATWTQRGGDYGIYWPDIDEYLSTEGLLRGAPAPMRSVQPNTKHH